MSNQHEEVNHRDESKKIDAKIANQQSTLEKLEKTKIVKKTKQPEQTAAAKTAAAPRIEQHKANADEVIYLMYMGKMPALCPGLSIAKLAQALTAQNKSMGENAIKEVLQRYCKANKKMLLISKDWDRGKSYGVFTESQIADTYRRVRSLEQLYYELGEKFSIKDLRKILKEWGARPGNILIESPDWERRSPQPLNIMQFIECCNSRSMESVMKVFGKTEAEVRDLVSKYQLLQIEIAMPGPERLSKPAKYPKYNAGASHGSGDRNYNPPPKAKPSRKDRQAAKERALMHKAAWKGLAGGFVMGKGEG